MNSDQSIANLGIVFVVILLFIIQVILIRWIFKIDKNTEFQRSTLLLLKEIALQNGVPQEKVDAAVSHFKKTER